MNSLSPIIIYSSKKLENINKNMRESVVSSLKQCLFVRLKMCFFKKPWCFGTNEVLCSTQISWGPHFQAWHLRSAHSHSSDRSPPAPACSPRRVVASCRKSWEKPRENGQSLLFVGCNLVICSWYIHDIFMIYSSYIHDMFMTCSWCFNDIYDICKWYEIISHHIRRSHKIPMEPCRGCLTTGCIGGGLPEDTEPQWDRGHFSGVGWCVCGRYMCTGIWIYIYIYIHVRLMCVCVQENRHLNDIRDCDLHILYKD